MIRRSCQKPMRSYTEVVCGTEKCDGRSARGRGLYRRRHREKFTAETFIVCAGRRNGHKLAPLAADVEVHGGRIFARSLDARKEEDITAFLHDADTHAPLEV